MDRSYNLNFESRVPHNTNRPFGLNRTPPTGGLPSACTVLRHSPVVVSQTRISPSYDPLTRHVPSRLKSTPVTGLECAGSVATHSPHRMSHSLIVSSNEPDTSKLLWGLNRQEKTKLVCPLNSTNASPVSALHRRNVLSSLAVAMYEAVGDQATSVYVRICVNNLISVKCVE